MLGGECHQLLGSLLKDRAVAAKMVKDTVHVQSKCQCIGMRQLARPSQGASALHQRLIGLSEQQKFQAMKLSQVTRDVVGRQLRGSMIKLIVEAERPLEMRECAADSARIEATAKDRCGSGSWVSLHFGLRKQKLVRWQVR